MDPPNCETETILTKDENSSAASPTSAEENCCSRLKRWFLVEPVLILYIFGVFPAQTISQKYILHWITKESLHVLADQNISHYQTNATLNPCHSNKSDPDYEFQEYVQSKSSQFTLYESIIYGVPGIFVTIILGAGSDLFGRRFAILPPLIGALLGSSIVTFVICTEASIYWLFLSDALYGCCGSFYSLLMGCLAYMADRTPPEKRMIRITFLEMSMLVPGVVSPIVFGKITTAFGYVVPLLSTVATSAVNLLYVLIFMPAETKQSKALPEPESVTACPSSFDKPSFLSILSFLWIQVRSMVALFTKKSASTAVAVPFGRLKITLLIAAFFIANLSPLDLSSSTLFMMNSPLCWDIDTIGLFSGVAITVSSVGAMIVAPLFKCCGMPDYVIALLAGLAWTATNVYKAFVQTTLMMFLTVSVSMIGILLNPSLRSLMSSQVNDDQQGTIFGAIACVEVTCDLMGTVIFNSVYSATLLISTGFVFLVMAAFYAAGSVLVCVYAVLIKLDARRGSALSVAINEPLLEDAEESDRLDDLHDDRIS